MIYDLQTSSTSPKGEDNNLSAIENYINMYSELDRKWVNKQNVQIASNKYELTIFHKAFC